jgi:hypothetical protein
MGKVRSGKTKDFHNSDLELMETSVCAGEDLYFNITKSFQVREDAAGDESFPETRFNKGLMLILVMLVSIFLWLMLGFALAEILV